MKILNCIAAAAALLLLAACEKTVTVDIPEKQPRLVVNGRLAKDELLHLKVGRSRGILDPSGSGNPEELYTVKTAVPVIFENGVPVDTLVYQPAEYAYRTIHNKRVRPGFVYSVAVLAPGFQEVTATSSLPTQSVIAGLQWVKEARVNSYGERMDEIILKFDDPAAERNYYRAEVWSTYGGGVSYPVACLSISDKDVEQTGNETDPADPETCFRGDMVLMQDQHFNGTRKQLKMYVTSGTLQNYTDPVSHRVIRPYVKLFRITEDEFKYLRSKGVYSFSSDNPFAEPVNVHTNVRNGYGIFSISTMAVDSLR